MVGSLIYSLLRAVLEVLVTSRTDQAKLQAEVLVLRRQVQVLERQIKRVHWRPPRPRSAPYCSQLAFHLPVDALS